MENLPNKNYDHVYVVIRIDTYKISNESRVCVLKVFTTEKDAANEVNRLQKLNDERKTRLGDTSEILTEYFYQLGRIKKGILITHNMYWEVETRFGRNVVLSVLKKRFAKVPSIIETAIQQMNDPIALESLVVEAATCQTLDEFAMALK